MLQIGFRWGPHIMAQLDLELQRLLYQAKTFIPGQETKQNKTKQDKKKTCLLDFESFCID